MAGISYTDLRTQIRNYTEVSSTVLSDSVIENIVLNAEYRIARDAPIDAYRKIAQDKFWGQVLNSIKSKKQKKEFLKIFMEKQRKRHS